ncbi:SMC family ATPase [Sporosarcina oncorhynchi]|uniref:Nuclease SbcCD subunit C n=1 Tax=Sporosarcina oncorhynchi TaxID=3056444 RepID=A0ABZ0L8X7_9BACL|nr:SMC family ATPase [Sporosarcina sp. T2O-4]WOV88533.1 SMC family ATPase [Sporosarcina sp. T2O-4]
MKPVQLTMTAFGPYKGTEVIDFRKLEDHRLFVVSGSTGAGKTTIFDGICFALYGQASGEDRTEARSMRSDFADDSMPTSVELIFEIQRRTYRVMRQIPYLKSGNKTETSAKYEFFELTDSGEVPVVDRQIVSEINRKIEELVGFTIDQFSQIVMLPQGEFRKFLTSDTENKETIMRKIFKTHDYREMVDVLKNRKDSAAFLLAEEKRTVDSLVGQIPSLIPTRESLIFNVLEQEYTNSSQVMHGLEEEVVYYSQKAIDDELNYKSLYDQHANLLTAFHSAKTNNAQFDQLEQRKMTFEKLTTEIPDIKEKEKRIANADRAAVIHEIEVYYKQQADEEKAKQDVSTKAEELVVSARKYYADVNRSYEEIQKQEPLRAEVTEQLIRLRDHLPAVTDLAAKESKILALSEELKRMKEAFTITLRKSEEEKQKLVGLKANIDKNDKILLPYDKLVETLNIIQVHGKAVQEVNNLTTNLKGLGEQYKTASSTFNKLKNEFEKLQNDWLDDQASHLAETLMEGEPCPVCGSAHHPTINSKQFDHSITREELESKRLQLSKAESAFRSAEAKYEAVQEQLKLSQLEVQKQQITDTLPDLKRKRREVTEQIEHLKMKREELVVMKDQLKYTEAESVKLDTKRTELEKTLYEKSSIYEKESALLQRDLNSIPEGLRKLNVLQDEIKSKEVTKRQLDDAWVTIQKKREEAKEKEVTAINSLHYVKQALEESVKKRKQAEVRFFEALKNSDFATEDEYRKSKLSETDKRNLKDYVITFNQQLHTIKESIQELEKLLEGKNRTDLTHMSEKVELQKAAYEKAFTDWNSSMEHEKTLRNLMANLKKSVEGIVELERKVSKLTDVYDVVRGQNNHKLSFERFIQIDYLERIIQSANARLQNLSNGQYELIRSDRQEVRGRQSGLGLDVYDAYTGQNRDVKTLSGGEKFNASLSLALGMADVIQSFQGAMSIETMFIDEGFGTLDEEALRKAVDTLIDLQKSGRMIGVISHVEELKTAFPAILEVHKSLEGHSETKFIIK